MASSAPPQTRGLTLADLGARAGAAGDAGLLLLPGALTVYLAIDSGGYFPAAPAVAAVLLLLALVLRVSLAEDPFAGFGWPLALAAGALSLHAGWMLLSARWSHAPGRALLDFDRALVYLLALVLLGSLPRTAARLRALAAGLAVGFLAIAGIALATRLYPATFPTRPNLGDSHLSYPLTYSNALGAVCAFGIVLCLYFTTNLRENLLARAASAAALPALGTTLYLTLSRGPVVAVAIGVGVYLVVGRPRGALTGLLATVPPTAAAIAIAYHHEALTAASPSAATIGGEGRAVALALLACTAAAAIARLVLAGADRRLEAVRLPHHLRRRVTAAGWAGGAAVLLVTALAAGAPGAISRQYDRFVTSGEAGPAADVRNSLFDASNRGLIDNWSIALDAFSDEPLRGQGAGAYEVYWNAHRPSDQASYNVVDAHSLYLQVLAEFGVVGLLTLLVVLGAVVAALLPFRREEERPLYAALLAVVLAWAAHAGIDWDWEMPAITLWVFALGGSGLALRSGAAREVLPSGAVRVVTSVLLLAVIVTPALVLTSQHQLDASRDAYFAGDCTRSMDRAAAAISTLDRRAEPYEVLAACQSRRGNNRLAVAAMEAAVARDPGNWRYHYELAVARGAAGLDPRAELRRALDRNPLYVPIADLLATLRRGETIAWDPLLTPERPGAGP